MKGTKCDSFNVISTSINGLIAARYDTFSEKLNYFYKQGGTEIALITCVSQIRHELLNDTYEHMRINHSLYKDKVDSFGFSALYYFKLRPIEISNISALEKLGFKELYPNAYKIYHLKNHSYYSHSIGRAKVVFVFIGYDETGAVDVNAVHTVFMRGFDVILVDARKENVRLYDVFDIAYRYSSKDITLFYIGSHGTESSLRSNMHTIPILGHDEKFQYRDGTLEITNYVKDSINTANFIRGLSYAASGYSAKITSFLIDMPWFFPAGKKINVLLASCNGQLAAFDTKYILEAGSEILILGENHYVQGNQHIVHVTNQDEINMLDYIANNKISDISKANLMRVYLFSIKDAGVGAPYYMKVMGHKLWGEPITKEFSCLTVLCAETEAMIYMRKEKNQDYIKLLTAACQNGLNQPEPALEEMWTREYLKTTQLNHFIKMVNQDAEEAREVVYGHIWDYCSYLYVALHNYMLGGDMH